jgi:hypothetical protein
MWRKKLRRVKKRRRLAARLKMINNVSKMEGDKKAGWDHASGRHVREGNVEGEEPKSKKARAGNNPLTSSCKCGALDHQRVSSKSCHWKGLCKKEIFKKHEMRMKDVKAVEATATAAGCTVPTKDIVWPTGKFLAPPERLRHQNSECDGMWHFYTCNSLGKLSMNRFHSKESYYNGAFAFGG